MNTPAERWAQYERQDAEWRTVQGELIAARPGQIVTAHQVTTEQRKRMLARGERPVDIMALLKEAGAGPQA
jgi:hypothetical protein